MALDFSITPCGFVQNDTEKEEIPAFAGMTSVGAGGGDKCIREADEFVYADYQKFVISI